MLKEKDQERCDIMDYKKTKDTIYIRIDKGESVIETIKKVCEEENIGSGHFQGIGACDEAVLATWIPKKENFTYHTFSGMLEMVSLMGNISTDQDGNPYSHSHAVFSYLDEQEKPKVVAGHLEEARVSYTGEIVLWPADNTIGRMKDSMSGIDVWDFAKFSDR
jgi:uncharacterized protein